MLYTNGSKFINTKKKEEDNINTECRCCLLFCRQKFWNRIICGKCSEKVHLLYTFVFYVASVRMKVFPPVSCMN